MTERENKHIRNLLFGNMGVCRTRQFIRYTLVPVVNFSRILIFSRRKKQIERMLFECRDDGVGVVFILPQSISYPAVLCVWY